MIIRSALTRIIFPFLLITQCHGTSAQDNRAQIPTILHKSYFEVNVGSIFYNFNALQVEPGFRLRMVEIPHAALRLIPAGYEFNKYLSAQISYMRPVLWVHYTYDKGTPESEIERAVWMNIAGITIKPCMPVSNRFSIYGEGGLVIVTRKGFNDDEGKTVVRNANYAGYTLGGGIKYRLNDRWGLMLSAVWSPENKTEKQPPISFFSAGFSNKLVPFSSEKVKASNSTGYIHPKQVIQIGLTSNVLGYGINNFVSEGTVPVFWGGEAEVSRGLTISYQRNIFHGTRIFSFDWGFNVSLWKSHENRENFYTFSLFPVLKWTFIRTRQADYYFCYTVAGPAFISKKTVDGKDIGEHFTFQDNMGIGMFLGEGRTMNAELRIGHYSNGDIFPGNEGVKIPLTFVLGYSF